MGPVVVIFLLLPWAMKECYLIKFVKIGTKDGKTGQKIGFFFFFLAWVTFVCWADFSFCIVRKASVCIIRSCILIKTAAPSLTAHIKGKFSRRKLRYISNATSSSRNVSSSMKLANCASFDFDMPLIIWIFLSRL